MTKHSDSISINGKHYNARTGQLVGQARNVDGVLPKHSVTAVLQKPAQPKPLVSTVKQPVMDIARAPAKHLPKRHTQPGQTLMRRALVKPQPSLKRQTKVVVANRTAAGVTIANITTKTSAAVIDLAKLKHANDVAKSALIKRFAAANAATQPKQLTRSASRAVLAKETAANGLAKQPSLDIFERALAHANGHKQTTPKHVKKSLSKAARGRRVTNFAASTLAVLLLAGFVGYQNLPNMKVQYASRQAGFKAELPDYKPSGFSLGKLSYQTGAVSYQYRSNSDDRAYAITQKPSAWDSQSLRENFVTGEGQQYRTTVAGGQTIYLYGDGNATWVDGGVWYQINAAGSLNERQLTDLAASM